MEADVKVVKDSDFHIKQAKATSTKLQGVH